MIKPKEKPIIFSGPSIPAIQNLKPGTWPPEPIDPGKPWKCMTRRIIKAPVLSKVRQPDEVIFDGNVCEFAWHGNDVVGGFKIKCPYPPGTRLWVRETWFRQDCTPDCAGIKDDNECPFNRVGNSCYGYKAQYANPDIVPKWCSPHFMPKAAARLWLEVKNVRVERIKEISNEDILAEGINDLGSHGANYDYFANEIWDNINAKRGYPWRSNPWVWVYEFMRTEAMP